MIQLIDAIPHRAYDWAGYELTQHAQHAADVHADRRPFAPPAASRGVTSPIAPSESESPMMSTLLCLALLELGAGPGRQIRRAGKTVAVAAEPVG